MLVQRLQEKGTIIKDTVFSKTGVIVLEERNINIKLYRNKRRIPFSPALPERAFLGAMVLKSLGILVPEVIGYFVQRKRKNLGGLVTLHDDRLKVLNFIFDDIKEKCGNNMSLYRMFKKRLFDAIADVFLLLHSCRVIHRDLKASNILVKIDWSDTENPFKIYLIDFENIVVDPPLLKRYVIKNFAQLNKSFPDLSMISVKERLYFLKKYLCKAKLDPESKKMVSKINSITGKIFKRKKLKFYYSGKS